MFAPPLPPPKYIHCVGFLLKHNISSHFQLNLNLADMWLLQHCWTGVQKGWNSNCCHFPQSSNVGVGGDTCADVLKTIDAQLATNTPDWVVLVCGENNFPQDSAEETFAQYSQLVRNTI